MLEIQIAPPFEVLINNGANQLLLDLVLDEEAYRNVQNFLRNKKSRGRKQNKKKRPIAKHNKCGSNNKYVSPNYNLDCTEHCGYLVK